METKPIKWSHSGLKDYEGCARRFHEVKVLKNYPFQETVHTKYGKQVHEAAELFVKNGTPIPPEYSFMEPIMESLMKLEGLLLRREINYMKLMMIFKLKSLECINC